MALSIAGMPEQKNIILPERTVLKLLDAKKPNSARLYLYLCLKGCRQTKQELCAGLGLTEKELADSEKELAEFGLICEEEDRCVEEAQKHSTESEQKFRNSAPVYSREEIVKLKNEDRAFAQIVKEASEVIRPLLTESELRELMTIYSYFGMPADCLIMLMHFTAARTARQSEGTRRPSLLTIKKEAFRWLDNGITTAERADAFIKKENRIMDTVESMVKSAGLGVCTNDDLRLLRSWAELGFGAEAVKIAAEISKARLGEIKLLYMGRIIKNWKNENLTDSKEILRVEKQRQTDREKALTEKARKQTGKKQISESGKKLSARELETLKVFEQNDG